jgi:putative multiple sugar transport system permease protein
MVMALVAKNYNVPWWAAVLIAIAIGILAGAWHGFFLAQLGIPGFITTLGGMMIFRGGVIWISHSISVPAPEQLKWFGAGYLPEWGPAFTGMNNSTLLLGIIGIVCYVVAQLRKYKHSGDGNGTKDPLWAVIVRIALMTLLIGYFTWLFGSGRVGTSFPVPGLILLLLTIVYHIITQRTKFGRHVYAVGGNKAAAALSGVNVKKTYFLTMVNMSLLASIAGILFVGRSTAAGPADGTSWEMDAIASVFIGGAAVSGGVGKVTNTIIGTLVIMSLTNGMNLMGVDAYMQYIVKGAIFIFAVAFDVISRKKAK